MDPWPVDLDTGTVQGNQPRGAPAGTEQKFASMAQPGDLQGGSMGRFYEIAI